MTDDYVSKLLTVSKQKECLFRLSSEYAKTRDKKWSIKIKSQKQRCRQVQRSDILPMIQWVAVHRYLEENEKQDVKIASRRRAGRKNLPAFYNTGA